LVTGIYDEKNYSYLDYCNSGLLVEWVCRSPEGLNIPDMASFPCPEGQFCIDGACAVNETKAAAMSESLDKRTLQNIALGALLGIMLLTVVLFAGVFGTAILSKRNADRTIKEIYDFKKDLKVIDQAHKN